MNKPSLLPTSLAAAAGLLILGSATLHALEPRSWVIIDGRVIEAELKKVSGAQITLLDKENRQVVLDKSQISVGDLDYVKENFPEEKKTGFAGSTEKAPAVPVPAKAAKIDPKTFVKQPGTFSVNTGGGSAVEPFNVLETPHFKIMYIKPADPGDVAELAERMWLDAAFFHATFPQKFRQRKMAVFLCPTKACYDYVGEWYSSLLDKAGNKEQAVKNRATWPRTAAGSINLPRDVADENSLIEHVQVFKAFRESTGTKTEPIRGVWDSFRVHCLAQALLSIQLGGVSEFGSKGYYAISTGHAYFKEIALTGKSETNTVSATLSGSGQGNAAVNTAGGFKDARNWASELKRLIRKGDIKPNLETLFNQNSESADEKIIVLSYSFARYLESTSDRLSAFNQLVERVSTSNQVPDPNDVAKLYGLADGKALEADWLKYVNSADFH